MNTRPYHVGIIGTGFIAKGLMHVLSEHDKLQVSKVLTRRPIKSITDLPVSQNKITHSVDILARSVDIVVECSGDTIHGTEMVEKVLEEGIPVVTMNAEMQLVSGSKLSQMGTFVEAEGDQPGSLAALDLEVRAMGFEPLVYGNIKRFLDENPSEKSMKHWAKKQHISLPMVTAFTDGTKVQIEQSLVANRLGATIACRGMAGIKSKDFEKGARRLAEVAETMHQPISDYILSPNGPAGVFIVAKHMDAQKPYLEYLKLGKGPYYVLTRPYHLCHLEIPKTLMAVLMGDHRYDFNNGSHPKVQVVATAKKKLRAGSKIKRGVGSFQLRGEAVLIKNHHQAVPISLMDGATLKRAVAPGKLITFEDVSLPKSRALELWLATLEDLGYRSVYKKKSTGKKEPIAQVDESIWSGKVIKFTNSFKLGELVTRLF